MTKKRGMVWNYYDKKVEGSQIIAFCKFCNQSYIQNATRMEKHLFRCVKCPENVKQQFANSKRMKARVLSAKANGQWLKTEWAEDSLENIVDEELDNLDNILSSKSETVDTAATINEDSANIRQSESNIINEEHDEKSNTHSSNLIGSSASHEEPSNVPSNSKKTCIVRKLSQWPLLPVRTTNHSPLQSKILQEQLLERRTQRRIAEIELRRKNLELERLQWEYDRDKYQNDLKWAHELRMMQLTEDRHRQMIEQGITEIDG